MHGSNQNIRYEDNNVEEFFDAEENDLSDLESIPSPSSFQVRNLSDFTSSCRSKINCNGNIYEGDAKEGKPDGFGKLSSKDRNKEEYVEGIWQNSQLLEVSSCQFVHSTSLGKNEIRIYGKDGFFTFNKDDFVAKIKFGELKELNFARPLNNELRREFLKKIIIIKVLEDKLLDKRDIALKHFLQSASSADAEDLLQLDRISERNCGQRPSSQKAILTLNTKILNEIIKDTYISEELGNSAKLLLGIERLLSNRNNRFPDFHPDIQPNLPNLLGKLDTICREKISNHKRLLLTKCPRYNSSTFGSMTRDIYDLPEQKTLYLSDRDIQLFLDLTTCADQPECLEQLWCAVLEKVKATNYAPLKSIVPLTNPIYLYLFKSFQELITEISNKAEIPKEDLLKVDSEGNWILLKKGSIEWGEKSSHITCSIEQQYHFIFSLMEHFKPGCYSHENKFEYKLQIPNATPETPSKSWMQSIVNVGQSCIKLGRSLFGNNKLQDNVPEEHLVWLYILDDAMEGILEYKDRDKNKFSKQSEKDFRKLLSGFLKSYEEFITGVKDDRYELFRVATHNMIKLAAQVSPIYCAIRSRSATNRQSLLN